jgi:hypothetical protein
MFENLKKINIKDAAYWTAKASVEIKQKTLGLLWEEKKIEGKMTEETEHICERFVPLLKHT